MNLRVSGFEWDEGNRAKCQKHGVPMAEIEDLFAHGPRIARDCGRKNRPGDVIPSGSEGSSFEARFLAEFTLSQSEILRFAQYDKRRARNDRIKQKNYKHGAACIRHLYDTDEKPTPPHPSGDGPLYAREGDCSL